MLNLPDDLHRAIAQALATVPTTRWLHEAQLLSQRYRAPRHADEQPFASGMAQALGYAALMMPATYAQLRGAMAASAARIPDWAPRSMLDLGSGPGTALWAAIAQWPMLQALTAWEREPAFITLGRDLVRGSSTAALRNSRWERVNLIENTAWGTTSNAKQHTNSDLPEQYDIVVLGHVLNELEPLAQRHVVESAWQRTKGLLLIVEPGTAAAFAVVRTARNMLLEHSAHTIAPCAHDLPCPLQNDWCHFPQRLKRPDFQRRARGAPSEWEDSKFAYAALARFPSTAPIWGRVIRESSSNKAYAETTISSHEGVAQYRALKRHRDAFRQLKALDWGTALEQALGAPVTRVDDVLPSAEHEPFMP